MILLYTNVLLITQSQSVSNLMSSSDQTGDSVPVGIIVCAVVLLIVIGAAGYMVYLKKRGEDGQL